MSALAGTTLELAILMASEQLMKFEKRRPDLGVVAAFDKYTSMLIDAETIKNNRKSARRQTSIPVLNRQTTPIQNRRSINITPVGSTSARTGLSWNTYRFDVGVTESINVDNYISAAADLANQLVQGIRDLLKVVDADFSAFLETSKYSALPASSLMTISGGAYKTTTADIFFNLPAVMRNLELEGPYQMLSNVEAIANRTRMETMGMANAQNLAKLLDAGYEFGYSKNLVPGTSQEIYMGVPTGSLGMISWVEYDSRVKRGSYDSGRYYDTMTLEFTDLGGHPFSLEMGFMYEGKPVDNSAVLPGLERSYTDAWSLAVDIAPVKAYSSEAGKSPIVKFLADKPAAPATT